MAQQAHEVEKAGRHRFTSWQHAGNVVFVFQQDVERIDDELAGQDVGAQHHEGQGPIQSFADAGRFAQLEFPHPLDELHDVAGQMLVDAGHLALHDLQFDVKGRLVDVEVKTAPLEGFREAAGGVAGEQDVRPLIGAQRADFRNADLKIAGCISSRKASNSWSARSISSISKTVGRGDTMACSSGRGNRKWREKKALS